MYSSLHLEIFIGDISVQFYNFAWNDLPQTRSSAVTRTEGGRGAGSPNFPLPVPFTTCPPTFAPFLICKMSCKVSNSCHLEIPVCPLFSRLLYTSHPFFSWIPTLLSPPTPAPPCTYVHWVVQKGSIKSLWGLPCEKVMALVLMYSH